MPVGIGQGAEPTETCELRNQLRRTRQSTKPISAQIKPDKNTATAIPIADAKSFFLSSSSSYCGITSPRKSGIRLSSTHGAANSASRDHCNRSGGFAFSQSFPTSARTLIAMRQCIDRPGTSEYAAWTDANQSRVWWSYTPLGNSCGQQSITDGCDSAGAHPKNAAPRTGASGQIGNARRRQPPIRRRGATRIGVAELAGSTPGCWHGDRESRNDHHDLHNPPDIASVRPAGSSAGS